MRQSNTHYDVVIIGAGHNGLTCAGYLARAGLTVKVVERRHIVGGAAVTEEFYPGFRNSICSYTVSLLNPKVIKDLELNKYGLEILNRPASGLMLGGGKKYLFSGSDHEAFKQQLATTHPRDAEQYDAFEAVLAQVADVLRNVVLDTPPNIGGNLMDLFRAGKLANKIRKLKPAIQREVIKLFTMSVADYCAQWFENDILIADHCFMAAVGNMQSIYAPGSAYVLMHHMFGEVNGQKGAWGHAKGGMGAITQAMAKSAEAFGCEIETSAPVKEVLIKNGVARGILLNDGRIISARAIVANTNPKLLFQQLIKRQHLNEDFAKQIDHYRCVSGSFRMNFALNELPRFTCLAELENPEQYLRGSILLSPSAQYMENAYLDAIKYGWSQHPTFDMFIPSLYDESLAPKGKHVTSLFVQHFNPNLPDGRSWDEVKHEAVKTIINTVNDLAPNFSDAIEGYAALSPLDLEREWGLIGGDIFHGCLHLDQVFSMRPVAQYANYRMPIANLFLCGSGTHPGGGVSGCPGHNAAHEIIKDFKRNRLVSY